MNIILTVSGFYSNATDAVAYYKELVMALFSKKDKYIRSIRIGQPGRSLSQNLKFLMNYFHNAQVVNIPFTKKI